MFNYFIAPVFYEVYLIIYNNNKKSGFDLEPRRDSDLCPPEFERHRSEVRI